MEKLDPTKDGRTPDVIAENIEKLRELFPEAFTEGSDDDGPRWKVDFDALKEIIGEYGEKEAERYSFTWHGKSRARLIAQTPSTGTLRPCPEESVNWDTTKNLFIEGDNLEVLKLLQKSYHKKVKMIYIDPPYNTGNDFIYPDKFADNLDTYLRYTGQIDDEGFKVSTNAETGGRYHTNWLNMMYPRLKLARNLLRDDGVIFISIDDHELANLVELCNEVFGEENNLGIVPVVSNLKGRSDDKFFATSHNYLLCYGKGQFQTLGVPLPETYLEDYPEIDDEGRRYRLIGLRKRGAGARREDRPNMYYPIYCSRSNNSVSTVKSESHDIEVHPKLSDGTDGRWRWGKDTTESRLDELVSRTVGPECRYDVFQIDYAEHDGEAKRIVPKSFWTGPEFANESGTLEVKRLLGPKVFDNPKPVGLVRYCLEQSVGTDQDIVLDFFAGSATTADAVIRYAYDSSHTPRFILVQLPEPIDPKSAAGQAEHKTIADVAKSRIRAVLASLEGSGEELSADGFRAFSLDSSNIKPWDADFDNVEQALLDSIDNIKPDRTESDVLYELLLKYGLDLAGPIETRMVAGSNVYVIGGGALIVCLADGIDTKLAEGIVEIRDEIQPEIIRVVFKDSGFKDDVAKTNVMQVLKQAGIEDVKSL